LGIDEQEQGSVPNKSSLILPILIGLFLISLPDPRIAFLRSGITSSSSWSFAFR